MVLAFTGNRSVRSNNANKSSNITFFPAGSMAGTHGVTLSGNIGRLTSLALIALINDISRNYQGSIYS